LVPAVLFPHAFDACYPALPALVDMKKRSVARSV